MKKSLTFIFLGIAFLSKGDSWTLMTPYPGLGQELPISFTIGNMGYVGCGAGASDIWQYNPVTNAWIQKASVPGGARRAGVAFTIGDKGYVTTGTGGNEFYEYDTTANTWTAKAPFAGGARTFAFAFSIDNKGYVGCGNSLNDLWQWDPATNVWTQKQSLPVSMAHSPAFVIDGKAYVSTGCCYNDYTYMYDPATDTWTQKASMPGGMRSDASGFALCGFGYVCTGGEGPYYNDLWQYNPTLDQWVVKTSIPTQGRDDGTALVIGKLAYFGLGQLNGSTNINDFWMYRPDGECIELSTEEGEKFSEPSVYPNPFSNELTIEGSNAIKETVVLLTDALGKEIGCRETFQGSTVLQTANLEAGIYLLKIDDGRRVRNYKVVKAY